MPCGVCDQSMPSVGGAVCVSRCAKFSVPAATSTAATMSSAQPFVVSTELFIVSHATLFRPAFEERRSARGPFPEDSPYLPGQALCRSKLLKQAVFQLLKRAAPAPRPRAARAPTARIAVLSSAVGRTGGRNCASRRASLTYAGRFRFSYGLRKFGWHRYTQKPRTFVAGKRARDSCFESQLKSAARRRARLRRLASEPDRNTAAQASAQRAERSPCAVVLDARQNAEQL